MTAKQSRTTQRHKRKQPIDYTSFKSLLSSAPLEGINLDRPQDHGREVDL